MVYSLLITNTTIAHHCRTNCQGHCTYFLQIPPNLKRSRHFEYFRVTLDTQSRITIFVLCFLSSQVANIKMQQYKCINSKNKRFDAFNSYAGIVCSIIATLLAYPAIAGAYHRDTRWYVTWDSEEKWRYCLS